MRVKFLVLDVHQLGIQNRKFQIIRYPQTLRSSPSTCSPRHVDSMYSSEIDGYASLIQACCHNNALEEGKRVHRHIVYARLHHNPYLQNELILMYSKCGSFLDGRNIFNEIAKPNFKLFNSMLRGCSMNGQFEEAVLLFNRMQGAGLSPDHYTFPALLKSLAALSALGLGRSIHGSIIKRGYDWNQGVCNALVNMYAKCGSLHDAQKLFWGISRRDLVTWNILISGYVQSQCFVEALELMYQMHLCEEQPNAITIVTALPACARLTALDTGQSIHAYAVRTGLESHTIVGNALVSMYAKCGSILGDAQKMFLWIPHRDVVSWNAIIAGFAENGLFAEAFKSLYQMLLGGIYPNYATVVNVLPVCAFLEDRYHGKEIHCYVLRLALDMNASVGNALVTFYSRIRDMKKAEFVFRKMYRRDLVSWNTVIAGYSLNGRFDKALDLFHEFLSAGMKPDSITIITILPVCAELQALAEGRKIHEYVLRHPELYNDNAVSNALINFYAKCGKPEQAFETFNTMSKRDIISWNTIFASYVEIGEGKQLFYLLNHMLLEGIKPDSITILSILPVCVDFGLRKTKEIHGFSIRVGLLIEPSVGNAVLDTYAKCGSIESAFKVFVGLSVKNVITGNSMISGYAKHGCREDAEVIFNQMCERDLTTWNLMVQVYAQNDRVDQALDLFLELQNQGMRPDIVSILSILPVCARLVSVHMVRQLHAYTTRACFGDVYLEGALLDIYSKCGSINTAYKLFRNSSQRDLVIFTAMIGGYAMHGQGEEALKIFNEMLELGIKADHVIMTAILSACSHAGLVEEGCKHFNSLSDVYGIKPTMEHHACMVDLLARAGYLKDAYDFITKMPLKANANVWGTLLGACKIHHDLELGKLVADHLFEIEGGDIGNYVVLSNIYAADGRWDGVEEVRKLMKMKDLKKPAGCSWIEVQRRVHTFVAGDSSHPERLGIYSMLGSLYQQIKEPLF